MFYGIVTRGRGEDGGCVPIGRSGVGVHDGNGRDVFLRGLKMRFIDGKRRRFISSSKDVSVPV